MKAMTPHYIDGKLLNHTSGVGREFGAFGIEAFLEPRAILE